MTDSRRIVPYLLLFGMLLFMLTLVATAGTVRASAPQTDDHLYVCEAVLTPTENEFIEIFNPTGATINLTDYYLSDDEDYALLPGEFGAGPMPDIGSSDFIARFPNGATITSGQTVVIAFDGAGFATAFGFSADYEIHGTDAGTPDMLEAYTGSIGASAGLTNSGENATMFYWDGATDLVSDIDMTNLGTPSDANDIANKTGVAVDGPDADTDTSTYLDDAFTMPQQASDPGSGTSTKRIEQEAGNELSGGGNGITGDDETTEDIVVTWDTTFTAPDPGICDVVSIPTARVVINEFAPKGTEWIELYNAGDADQDLTGWTITDGDGSSDALAGVLTAGSYLIVNNTFSLSNSGDEIELYNDSAELVDSVAYGNSGAAPLAPFASDGVQYSAARVSDGQDSGNDANDWNLDPTPTQGSANDAAGVNLGSALIINEVDLFPSGTEDRLELYNPSGSDVDVSGWYISDGDDVAVLNGGLIVPANGFLALEENVDWVSEGTTGVDFTTSDVAYLFDSGRVRLDQQGWDGAPFIDPGECVARVPDGAGPNDGYEWLSSGGDVTLFVQACTMGASNGVPPTSLVINEILADPHPDSPPAEPNGDANGDGVRDSTQDEFVEIVNVSGANLDLSGWTLSDENSTRHVFPADTIVPDTCSVVVFGGGTPTGTFGGSVVQTASSGALGLNNAGDTVTLLSPDMLTSIAYTYGSEGGNDQSLTRDPDITGPEPLVEHTTAAGSNGAVHSPGTMVDGTAFVGCPIEATALTIMEIQDHAHLSPFEGDFVETSGIVTVVRPLSFYMQDPQGDGDTATSDAILVFVGSAPSVAVGDDVTVVGTVTEFYPGGYDTGNLSTTQISDPEVMVNSSGNPIPAPIVLGNGGRIPPDMIIDNDSTGDVNMTPNFDPDQDGIDFYESLESMLIQVNDAIVVDSNRFGEMSVVGDNGANATFLTPRGGIYIRPNDFNPERIIFDDSIVPNPPLVKVGDSFSDPLIGIVDYSFGNFKMLNFDPLPLPNVGGLTREVTPLVADPLHVTTASMNVENLSAVSDQAKIDDLASEIVTNLQSPDIIALQEIQDNNGTTDDGTVDASETYGALIAAIQTAGGPVYEYRDIAPLDGLDGGVPGGNIRVGFLFNPARVTFIDRPGGDATTATSAVLGGTGVELTFSPGRIDPTNTAFDFSRKPLAGEFMFNGKKIFVISNHFNSKGGDDPLFGRVQPPMFPSEIQRGQQAQVVNDFVDSILALDTNSDVIVLGDFNDFQFSSALQTLAGDVMTNLMNTLPENEQYSYIFDGNSQVLDSLLVTDNLLNNRCAEFDVVHANAEFSVDNRPTDHDLLVGRFCFDMPPTAVVLADFSATVVNGAVELSWVTAAEIDTVGFNVVRSAELNGVYEQLNGQLIGATASAGSGASYAFSDAPELGVWYYAVEDVSTDGTVTRHPAIKVSTLAPTAVSLTGWGGDLGNQAALPLLLAALGLLGLAGWTVVRRRDE
ncbi:MAG: lamin tail domain-containing protein [Anaerolineae bacterium]|nr:lamin tail domain-containing protein [Anaerolineae bacterium]